MTWNFLSSIGIVTQSLPWNADATVLLNDPFQPPQSTNNYLPYLSHVFMHTIQWDWTGLPELAKRCSRFLFISGWAITLQTVFMTDEHKSSTPADLQYCCEKINKYRSDVKLHSCDTPHNTTFTPMRNQLQIPFGTIQPFAPYSRPQSLYTIILVQVIRILSAFLFKQHDLLSQRVEGSPKSLTFSKRQQSTLGTKDKTQTF